MELFFLIHIPSNPKRGQWCYVGKYVGSYLVVGELYHILGARMWLLVHLFVFPTRGVRGNSIRGRAKVVDGLYMVGRCGVVGNKLAIASKRHGFESEHRLFRLFSYHSASAFSKLRSLAKCALNDSVRRLL